MKLLLKILFFVFTIFQTNICEAKVFVFGEIVTQIRFIESAIESKDEVTIDLGNGIAITCKSESDLVDYRNGGIGVVGGAAKGSTKLISHFSTRSIDDAVAYEMKNKVTHVFGKAAHNLDPLVTKLGGQENTVRAVLNAANGKLPSSGVFNNIPVNVGGSTVFIRGNVINGVPRLGTMFIP